MISVQLFGRTYGYHLPNGLHPATPAPVVLILHALGINASLMEQATAFSNLADKEGFIAVYADGTEQPNVGLPGFPAKIRMWNAGGVFTVNGVDDVAFLTEVLADLVKRTNTNQKKTYVVGMSNGAMMAYRLAAESTNGFAAMAAVAGTITSTSLPWKPLCKRMPVLHIHGTSDRIVTYEQSEWHPSVEDVMSQCARFNQCGITPAKGKPVPAGDPFPVEKWDYPIGLSGAEVVLYRVMGGGHTWPQQANISGLQTNLGAVTTSLNATQVIWDFLRKF